VTIPHHRTPGPNAESYAAGLGEDLAEDLQTLEQSSDSMDFTVDSALLHLDARCCVDPRAAKLETWEAVVAAMQVECALFEATAATEGVVECRIAHKVRIIPALGRRTYADAGNWLNAFWLAVICREKDRLTRLCEIPVDRLRTVEGAYDEYVYHWVDALQAYWLQRPGLVEKLTAAIQGSHPDAAAVAPRDLLQNVLYPPINLFYRFLLRDEEGFNQALVEGLELYKRYWTADEDRANDPSGTVPLALLAITCLAYDGGLPIEVVSDYLPKHLVGRGWLGEFPT
jgi:hypothetical protein